MADSYRHTCITDALQNGVDVATVAELTGTSLEMSQRHYGRLAKRPAHLKKAAAKALQRAPTVAALRGGLVADRSSSRWLPSALGVAASVAYKSCMRCPCHTGRRQARSVLRGGSGPTPLANRMGRHLATAIKMKQTRREFITIAGASVLIAAGCSESEAPVMHASDDPPNASVDLSNVTIDLPLFDALWKLDPKIQELFPRKFGNGLDALGVFFVKPHELENGGYLCTPTNTLTFAWTGGDGVHFSFLVRNSRVDHDSPILLTAPANSSDENRIVAEDFRTFLRLGIQRGYFALEQLVYDPEETLHVYGTPGWQPTESRHYSVGFLPDDRQKEALALVADSLQLQPFCYTLQDFEALQERYMPLLRMTQKYNDL